MSLSKDESTLIVTGGMTSSCDSDSLVHTFDLTSGGPWTSTTPSGTVRRRGAGSVWVDNGSSSGAVMVVGGMADTYVCCKLSVLIVNRSFLIQGLAVLTIRLFKTATSTFAYPAADVLSLPITTKSLVSTRNLPTSLTGSNLSVAEFAMASTAEGTVYLAGGQTVAGDLVSMATIGVWTSANGWTSQTTTGDLPAPRIGASLVAHPGLDLL